MRVTTNVTAKLDPGSFQGVTTMMFKCPVGATALCAVGGCMMRPKPGALLLWTKRVGPGDQLATDCELVTSVQAQGRPETSRLFLAMADGTWQEIKIEQGSNKGEKENHPSANS